MEDKGFLKKITGKLPKLPNNTIEKLKPIKEKMQAKMPFLVEKTKYCLRFLFVFFLRLFRKVVFKANNIDIELRKRIITSIVFVSILLFAIAVGQIVYNLFITLVGIAMCFEAIKICKNITDEKRKILTRKIAVIYIVIFAFSLMMIRNFGQGFKITLWMFLVVWGVDTFAYIFGKKYGKIKLAPAISPGKTYEGAIFGSVSGLLISMLLYTSFYTGSQSSFSGISFFIFSVIVVVISQLGDLAESYIKRLCGVKDSGKFLPGHGGVCDRFDSLIFVAPFVFFIVLVNGRTLF